jgi:hypothetical protein
MCKGKYSGWHLRHKWTRWKRSEFARVFTNTQTNTQVRMAAQERCCERCGFIQHRKL